MIEDTIMNKLYDVLEKNIEKLSVDQAIHLRDRINGRILKMLEKNNFVSPNIITDPSHFTKTQFGMT